MLGIALPVAIAFGLGEWLRARRGVSGEATRKLAHVAAGATVLAMPWLVTTHWTVLALSAGFLLLLGGARAVGLLQSIHAVDRRTTGAELYPIAVYLTYLLASGDPALYCIPIAIMAVSDPGAAIVGRRMGVVRYRVVDDFRSLGGSVTFFALAFTVTLVSLALAGKNDLPMVLVTALLVALLAMAAEAVSVGGADNLLIPLVAGVVLRSLLGGDRAVLGDWILGATLTLALLLVTATRARLDVSAFLLLFLVGSLAHGFGGHRWLGALTIPWLAWLISAHGSTGEAVLARVGPLVLVTALVVLAAGAFGAPRLELAFMASASVLAAQLGASGAPNGTGDWLRPLRALAFALLVPLATALVTRTLPGLALAWALVALVVAWGANVLVGRRFPALEGAWRGAFGIATSTTAAGLAGVWVS